MQPHIEAIAWSDKADIEMISWSAHFDIASISAHYHLAETRATPGQYRLVTFHTRRSQFFASVFDVFKHVSCLRAAEASGLVPGTRGRRGGVTRAPLLASRRGSSPLLGARLGPVGAASRHLAEAARSDTAESLRLKGRKDNSQLPG